MKSWVLNSLKIFQGHAVTLTRNPWCWASLICVLVAVLLGLSPFFRTGYFWWLELAESWNPGIDAPDNWAVGLTYCMKTVMAFGILGMVLFWIGVYRSGVWR